MSSVINNLHHVDIEPILTHLRIIGRGAAKEPPFRFITGKITSYRAGAKRSGLGASWLRLGGVGARHTHKPTNPQRADTMAKTVKKPKGGGKGGGGY